MATKTKPKVETQPVEPDIADQIQELLKEQRAVEKRWKQSNIVANRPRSVEEREEAEIAAAQAQLEHRQLEAQIITLRQARIAERIESIQRPDPQQYAELETAFNEARAAFEPLLQAATNGENTRRLYAMELHTLKREFQDAEAQIRATQRKVEQLTVGREAAQLRRQAAAHARQVG